MKTEIIENMSFEDYAKRPGINAGLLATVDQYSLAHAKAQIDGRAVYSSDALDFGEALHALWLEGRECFIEQPATYRAPKDHAEVIKGKIGPGDPIGWNNNAKICKAWVDLAEKDGKIVLSASEVADIRGMVEKLNSHPELRGIKGRSELSIFTEMKGVPVKIRVDTLPDDVTRPVIDLKSARDAEPEKFVRAALGLRYHLKSAFYTDVLKIAAEKLKMPSLIRCGMDFIAQEKKEPYGICIVKFRDTGESFLRVGRKRYRGAFDRLTEAMKTGYFPSYETCHAEEFAPTWTLKELEAA